MTKQDVIDFSDKTQEIHKLSQTLSSMIWDMRLFSIGLTEFLHQHDRMKAELENLKLWRDAHERAGVGGDRKGTEPVAHSFDANGSEVD